MTQRLEFLDLELKNVSSRRRKNLLLDVACNFNLDCNHTLHLETNKPSHNLLNLLVDLILNLGKSLEEKERTLNKSLPKFKNLDSLSTNLDFIKSYFTSEHSSTSPLETIFFDLKLLQNNHENILRELQILRQDLQALKTAFDL